MAGKKRSTKKTKTKYSEGEKNEVNYHKNSEALSAGRGNFHIPPVVQGCRGRLPMLRAGMSSPTSGKAWSIGKGPRTFPGF